MAASQPTVSIIICAYKSGQRIRRTVAAVLAQSFDDFELIVIDDASGDETADVVKEFGDARLRVIGNETNLGVVASRNKGLALARGAFIATCDHDDVWRPEKLARQMAYMKLNPECGVCGTAWVLHNISGALTTNSQKNASPAYLKWLLVRQNSLLHSSLLMRSTIIRQHDIGYDPALRFADDWQLVWDISCVSNLGAVDEPLVDYYLHGENWSLLRTEEMHTNGAANIRTILSTILKREISQDEARRYFDVVVCGKPCLNLRELFGFGALLDELQQNYIALFAKTSTDAQDIQRDAAALWWRLVRAFAMVSGPRALRHYSRTLLGRQNPITARNYLYEIAKAMVRTGIAPFRRGGEG